MFCWSYAPQRTLATLSDAEDELLCRWLFSAADLPCVLLHYSWATSKAIHWEEEPSLLHLCTSSQTERSVGAQEVCRDPASFLRPPDCQQHIHHHPSVCRRHHHPPPQCQEWSRAVTAVPSPWLQSCAGVVMETLGRACARKCGRNEGPVGKTMIVVNEPLTINALSLSLSLLQHEMCDLMKFECTVFISLFLFSCIVKSVLKDYSNAFYLTNNCKCEHSQQTHIPPLCMSNF